MTMLRIGLAQCRQTGDIEENAQTVLRFLKMAAERGVQILCFPEAQTVGYRADIARADAPVPVERLEELHNEVAHLCRALNLACILGTETPLEADPEVGKPYNSALVIDENGEILGVHHKTRLTPLDAMAYTPGDSFHTFELHGVRVGVVICFEAFRFAETTAACVGDGARLVFHPQNNTTRPNAWKVPIHHAMMMTRAAENTIWFASCNACLVPHQNCESRVIAPDGRVHARADMGQEQLLVSDIEIERATRAMFRYDMGDAAEILFADTVRREEYSKILPRKTHESEEVPREVG
jgi:predicted amidohydrolase